MKALERFGRVFEVLCLVGCGFFIGATITAVRVRASVTAGFTPQLDVCKADLAAHDKFMRLVVTDVEQSVSRAARVLESGGAYARAQTQLDPPIFHANEAWWVIVDGKCSRLDYAAVTP